GGVLTLADYGLQLVGDTNTSSNPELGPTKCGSLILSISASGPGGVSAAAVLQLDIQGNSPGGQPVVSAIDADPNPALPGCAVAFTARGVSSTSNCLLSYKWNFGDGSISYEIAPTHVYNSAGTFDASLTVSNGLGSATQLVQVSLTA